MLHNCGYYFQINLDSVINSGNEAWHKRVLELLNAKLVDFIGTDAHHSKRRSPEIAAKVNYLYAHYDKEYVNEILFENARRLLL